MKFLYLIIKALCFFSQEWACESLDAQLLDPVRKNDTETIQFLLEIGGDPNAQDAEAFFLACMYSNPKTIELLIEALGHAGTFKETPLLEACERKQGEIARLLLSVNMEDNMGWLRAASLYATGEVPQLLGKCPKGAMLAFKDEALEYVVRYKFDAFMELISYTGIDIADSQSLLEGIFFSGDDRFVKYAFDHAPSLQDAYLIGLSNCAFMYTTGTRLILEEYVKTIKNSYIVWLTLDIVADEEIISHFSALINPGAEDTYPRHDNPFTLEDMNEDLMEYQEKLYQKVVEAAQKYEIPYLGTCAGAQHLTLNTGGSLIRKGHKSGGGKVEIRLLSGTIPHYLFLTEEEKGRVLANCEFPEIIISDAFVSHSYSAVPGMLGEGILLGGVSSKGIPEAFSLGANKIGIQFHPEHYHPDHIEYVNKLNIPELNRQKIFLENVFEMFEGHYKSRQYAKRAGVDMFEAKAAIARANNKLLETLKNCQAGKILAPRSAVWTGIGIAEGAQPFAHLYILPGITPEDLAYEKDRQDLKLYSKPSWGAGAFVARDFFAGGGTKNIYIHFADGSVFYLQSDNETAFEEGKSRFVE